MNRNIGLEKFGGQSSFKDWKRKFDIFCKVSRIDEEEKSNYILLFLSEKVEKEYMEIYRNNHDQLTYEEACQGIESRQKTSKTRFETAAEEALTKHTKEDRDNLTIEKINEGITDIEVKKRLYRINCRSLEELLERLSTEDKIADMGYGGTLWEDHPRMKQENLIERRRELTENEFARRKSKQQECFKCGE
ncbi:hypothetical protein SNEBB_000451, partial [Seison nebaliae]